MVRFTRLLSCGLLLTVLAACGGAASTPTSAPAATATTAPTEAAAATATTVPTEAAVAEATATAASDTTTNSENRSFTHALGEISIPNVPQRVIALDWMYLEDVLALGVQPVGAIDLENYPKWVDLPLTIDPSVVSIGANPAPDFETIAALKPDLILVGALRGETIYDQLNAIAPTMMFNPYLKEGEGQPYDEMTTTFSTIAAVLGKETEGAQVLAKMEQTFANAKAQLAEAGLADANVLVAQTYASNNAAEVRLFTDNAAVMEIIKRLGLKNAWSDPTYQVWGFSSVGTEALAQFGDVHMLYITEENNDPFQSDAIKPYWDSLEFVKAGQAHTLDSQTWTFGGPIAAEVFTQRVTAALLSERK
ncbi:iron-siderophore ABC transporter substrate-binding protein [Herpetosiphon gulosus]|uniref:Petrobactin-binding protein FpuA n=1 Tax=Herpetosiphon gulosus TaxID=1973496 RepID=A0ABP9X034_9CHLR